MSQRFKESKATTAKHAEQLRAMLKRPENKVCVDCKRNDPRWASTNIGAFLCIRCSGIHRGLGVHISRVRSVDLDTWTPDQISHMDRWGNKKANKYWEAHLKEGHQPPEHKLEAFIRSKYESKRWAMQGPIPDPATLGDDSDAPAAPASATLTETTASPRSAPSTSAKPASAIDLLGGAFSSAPVSVKAPPSVASSVPGISLSSSSHSSSKTSAAAQSRPAQNAGGGLFDLDFSPAAAQTASTAVTSAQAKRNNADIMSLFATAPSPPTQQPPQYATHQIHQNSQPSVPAAGLSSGLDAFSSLSIGPSSTTSPPTSFSSWAQMPPQPTSNHNLTSGVSMFASPTASSYSTQAAARPASNSISGGNPWATPAAASVPAASTNTTSTSSYPAYGGPSLNNNLTSQSSTNHNASAAPAPSLDLFNSHDVWGSSNNHSAGTNDAFGGFSSAATTKSSGFDDLWS